MHGCERFYSRGFRSSACAEMPLAVVRRCCVSCWPVAALNFTASSVGIRPRSLTSVPCALAHSRICVVSGLLAVSLRPLRVARREVPLTRRSVLT